MANAVQKCILIDATPGTEQSFMIPSDYINSISVECIGAGGRSYRGNGNTQRTHGAGAGAYAFRSSFSYTPCQIVNCFVGLGGGSQGNDSYPNTADTWWDKNMFYVMAQGGGQSTATVAGSPGDHTLCAGDLKRSGGSTDGWPNGGGAAGKYTDEGEGSANSTVGGPGDGGFGGLGGNSTHPAGHAGTEWTYAGHNGVLENGTAGSGGGSWANATTDVDGGLYGGGPSASSTGTGYRNGGNGCIFFTYWARPLSGLFIVF